VLAELGRQPYSARDFLVKYQDRILMGKDIYDVNEYKWYGALQIFTVAKGRPGC
jgi:hypothetical protein